MTCDLCDGSGRTLGNSGAWECPYCHGTGGYEADPAPRAEELRLLRAVVEAVERWLYRDEPDDDTVAAWTALIGAITAYRAAFPATQEVRDEQQ